MGVGGLLGHVGVVAAAEHVVLLGHQLGLGGVTVLGDDAAAIGVDEGLGGLALLGLVAPSVDLVHIDQGVGVGGLGAQGEGIDAGAGLGILPVVGGHIADVVVAQLHGLHAGGDAGQVAGLIDAAEVVVEVGVVGHVASSVGEDNVGILLSLVVHGVDIAEGDAEHDVGPLVDHGVDGVGHGGVVGVRHVVHHDQVGGVQAQGLHGGGDAVVVLEGVAGGVVLAGDIDGAHLEVGRAVHRGGHTGAAGGAGIAGGRIVGRGAPGVIAAGGQGQAHGRSQSQCKDFLHSSSSCFHCFSTMVRYIKTEGLRL